MDHNNETFSNPATPPAPAPLSLTEARKRREQELANRSTSTPSVRSAPIQPMGTPDFRSETIALGQYHNAAATPVKPTPQTPTPLAEDEPTVRLSAHSTPTSTPKASASPSPSPTSRSSSPAASGATPPPEGKTPASYGGQSGTTAPSRVPAKKEAPPVAATPKEASPPHQQKPKKSNTTLVVLIVALVVCLSVIAVLGISLLQKPKEITVLDASIPTADIPEEIYTPTTPPTVPTFTEEVEPLTEPPTTEPPTTEPLTTQSLSYSEQLNSLNRKHENYFDFQPDAQGNILSHSSSRLIDTQELYGMTEHQVCMARNEIYARHGYIFQTEKYNEYFSMFSWYTPTTRTLPDLNEIESENVKTISAYESAKGW